MIASRLEPRVGAPGCVRDKAIDRRLQINNGPEDAVVGPTARQDAEKAFDRVQP
jgi:hypothetical protein